MNTSTINRATRFAAVYALLRASADVADHWIQTDHQAATKGQQDGVPGQSTAAGRRSCAAHVATYTAAQAATVLVADRVLGLGLRPSRVAAALLLSAASHYVADRRVPLRRLAKATKGGRFVELADHGMNGAYLLDQAWHHAFETCAAVIASG
ncbi:hypothetical protein CFP65_1382 [Kitasatospora sp. MMS16-BH015]|uniref:hypothetical protein n=1 Tax=Kitasatospora sp. MMS16-BH015 TaxID=2018025 RepID=UPI000CA0CC1D|nr:hypothetical protein [Kitasatospora sp. MMS16-BH015]AUG76281.1 hypothetical protein CFP65_1382 [Kitasatospora sp. MMS16-BH015]